MAGKHTVVPVEQIERTIFLLRGQKVLLSPHLADLYGVEARILVQAVKRNLERFPEDFMFQLTPEEYENLKSQIVISSWGGPRRARPYAFTEQGVAMTVCVCLCASVAKYGKKSALWKKGEEKERVTPGFGPRQMWKSKGRPASHFLGY